MQSNRASFIKALESFEVIGVVAFFLFILHPSSSFAISDLLVGSFVDDGISALGRGGMKELPSRQDFLDFDSPLFLDSHGQYRIEGQYEHQRTVRIFHGQWDGTHAYSDSLQTAAAAPFSLFDGRLKGNAAAGYGKRTVDVLGEDDREGLAITDKERVGEGRGGIYLQALDRLYLGVSLVDTELRSSLEAPVEVEAAPLSFLRLGYKHSYQDDFLANFNVSMSGYRGNLPLKDLETIDEGYLVLDYADTIYVKYANELGDTCNRRIEGKLKLPYSFYLVGDYARRDFPHVNQQFTVDGTPAGKLEGDFGKREYRVGIGSSLGKRWTLEANYRHFEFSTQGGGIASSKAVTSFWPSLLIGNYNYLYQASLSSDQYHLGAEYRGERFSCALGFQYLDLRPKGDLGYWRSVLFGLGQTGAGNLNLTIDRVQMLFFSLGLGYRWRNVELRYAAGQFIPIGTHDSESKPASPGAAGGGAPVGGGGGGGWFSSLADKVNYNPGGNLQRVMLTVSF